MVHQAKGAVIDVELDMFPNLNVVTVTPLAITLMPSIELIVINASVSLINYSLVSCTEKPTPLSGGFVWRIISLLVCHFYVYNSLLQVKL